MVDILGGMFGLPTGIHQRPHAGVGEWPFLSNENLYVANARCAIYCLLRELRPPKLWIPSFCCPTVCEAATSAGIPLDFYAVDERLHPSLDWLRSMSKGDVLLVLSFFGFPADVTLIEAARRKGAIIVEDASQALLSAHVGQHADYVVYSPRKVVGVPDGGILVSRCGSVPGGVRTEGGLSEWQLTLLEAAICRREYDLHGGDRQWYQLFQSAKQCVPIGRCAMSDVTRSLLQRAIDFHAIADTRVRLFNIVNSYLAPWGMFAELVDGTVPIGYPIRVRQRDLIRSELYKHGIYPPVHWPLDGIPSRFAGSHHLANEIMTLPCDQRCNEHQAVRMAETTLQLIRAHE